jgi:hypothetical protein
MPQVAYTVRAELTSEEMRTRYLDWLAHGHAREVCRGGALSATLIAHDAVPGSQSLTAEVRYIFPDRASLDRYLAQHAPRLRAEGLALFGPQTGTVFTRTVGEIAAVVEGVGP